MQSLNARRYSELYNKNLRTFFFERHDPSTLQAPLLFLQLCDGSGSEAFIIFAEL
jgi:hypothetical protein